MPSSELRLAVAAGLGGGCMNFSTFSGDAVTLLEDGHSPGTASTPVPAWRCRSRR
ncbi:MAG TPA: hypothetical protein VLE53_04065 [Gemmatimonadaceae bacterium]|nr:hypothetical protein [Gemmatimonadaceae bacterium]